MSEFLYPLDTTGSALSNRVRGEFQTLSPPTQSDNFHFIIPKSGPYYRDTLKIRHVSSNRLLIRGVDWEPGHYFHSASYETEGVKGGIYQSILFLDRSLSGQIHLEEYFVLGGEWSLDENKILEILSNRLWDPRTITYEQVSGKPEVFPPIEHMHPAGDLTGMREQVEATYQVSAAIREQTQELPGKLELILENYYDSGDIDDLLLGLSEQLIGGIAGPQIEAMLRDVVAGMIENYYTKSQVDGFIANVVQSINALYTNAQIDSKLAPLASKTYVDNAVADKVDLSTFEAALENVTGGAVYQGDLNDLENRMSSVDANLQDQIDAITQLVASLGGDMSNYVTKDEFLELVPDRDYDSSYYLPGTIDAHIVEGGPVVVDDPHYIDAEILSHTKADGKISAIEFMIHEGRSVNISVDGKYSGVENVPAMMKNIQLIDEDEDDVQIAGHILYLSLFYQMGADGNVEDQEWTINSTAVNQDIIDFKLTDMELSERFDSSIKTSTADEIAIGYVDVTGSSPIWIPFINTLGYTRIERKTVTISKANALAGNKVTVEFSRDNGHRCTSQVNSCLLKDPSGNSIPIHGVRHLFRDMLWNTVIVDIPKVDLSNYSGTPTLTLELEVTTKTLR